MSTSPLDRIAIVLVEPQGPRNVGSAARALKNFGLTRLVLVGDAALLAHDECREMGVGAHDVLETARVTETLDAAIAEAGLVIGTTARRRHRVGIIDPTKAARHALAAAAAPAEVAILFGREDHGLFADELSRCHHVISIETSARRATLNLAQAVLIVAYEIFRELPEDAVTAHAEEGPLVQSVQRARLERELIECFEATGYLHEGNRVAVEGSIRRLLVLGPMQTRDARHLFGLARRIKTLLEDPHSPTSDPGDV